MVKYTLKILRYEHRKISKVCLTIFLIMYESVKKDFKIKMKMSVTGL